MNIKDIKVGMKLLCVSNELIRVHQGMIVTVCDIHSSSILLQINSKEYVWYGKYSVLKNFLPVKLRKEETKVSENRMEDVAKLLGVKLNEEFEAEGYAYNPCKLTNIGLFNSKGKLDVSALGTLLTTNTKIKKLPFKPHLFENYFYFNSKGRVEGTEHDGLIHDVMCIALGNCFRTKEEARENREKILSKLGVKLDEI